MIHTVHTPCTIFRGNVWFVLVEETQIILSIIIPCIILCIRDSAGKKLKKYIANFKTFTCPAIRSTCLDESCFEPWGKKDKNTLVNLASTSISPMPTLGIKPRTQMWKASVLPTEQTGQLGLTWLLAQSSVLTSNPQKQVFASTLLKTWPCLILS